MKKTIFWLSLVVIPLATVYATATWVGSKTDGYHIGTATSAKVAFYDGTPQTQAATTVTAQRALMNTGFIAGGTTGADYAVQHATVALTAANIIAMYTTPVVLVAAPGSGKSIVVTKLAFTIARTATAFTGGGAVIVQYDSTTHGGGTQALDSTIAASVVTNGANTTYTFRNGAVISDSTAVVNKGLYISNADAVFAAGTGVATVDIWYVVVGGA